MLKGDLTSTPLAPLLIDLANDSATGCLVISDDTGDDATLYLKAGLVYAVSVPGKRPQLGAKLVSSGALVPEALADALEAQRSELQGWRLGELLVHLGYVDQPVVEAFVKEQVNDALWDLMKWTKGRWRFRKNIKTREDVAPPMAVSELLAVLRERGFEWESISAVVHGPAAVPVLSARGNADSETTLDNDAWTMLCKIDGERTVADLAREGGYTLFEAGQVIVTLVRAGLIDIEEEIDVSGAELYGASALASALFADSVEPVVEEEAPDDDFSRLARLVSEVAGEPTADEGTAATLSGPREMAPDEVSIVPLQPQSEESFAASIARVSSALNDVLGPAQDAPETSQDKDLRARRAKAAAKKRADDPEWQRHERLRNAAAAELAAAHALAEALRGSGADTPLPRLAPDDAVSDVADVADTAATSEGDAETRARKAVDRLAAEAEAQVQAERAAAEELAWTEYAEREAARAEAERAEAERLAAEEAARVEAERLDAERAEREAAEQLEAERLAAEEAIRLEAERVAAEEAERIEAERVEAERVAAEQAEAERVAAEQAEAERIEAERVEAERVEAERIAAEQAEAERIEAERIAAEAAARAEAERIEAEAQTRRELAEAQRRADEEAERAAAEAAAQAEAEREAADAAAREAAAEAERQAAENAAQDADQAAAAAALLIELAGAATAEPDPEPALDAEPDSEPAPEPIPEYAGAGYGGDTSDIADTAALLRELSSLGLDDDDRGALTTPVQRTPARSSSAAGKQKKKRGLFGL